MRRYAFLLGALGLAACGDSPSGQPTFSKTVPSVEQRYHGKTLADWKDLDPQAPVETRAATAYALAALETEPAESAALMLELLRAESPSVRLAAVIAVGRMRLPSEEAARILVGHFGSPDEPLRRHARIAAGQLGAAAVGPLTEALASERVRIRWGAAAALASVGQSGEPAVARLRALASDDEHASVRRQALFTLPRLGPAGIEATLPFLRSGDLVRRHEAALGLSGAGAGAVGSLSALLRDPDAELAAVAGGILADLGPKALPALDVLLETLRRDGPPRFNAAEALIAIGQPAVPALELLAKSDDEDLAAIAQYALEKIRGP